MRKKADPTVQFKARIPASLHRKIKLLLYDPATQKIEYGSLSDLVTVLLKEWLEKRVKERESAEVEEVA